MACIMSGVESKEPTWPEIHLEKIKATKIQSTIKYTKLLQGFKDSDLGERSPISSFKIFLWYPKFSLLILLSIGAYFKVLKIFLNIFSSVLATRGGGKNHGDKSWKTDPAKRRAPGRPTDRFLDLSSVQCSCHRVPPCRVAEMKRRVPVRVAEMSRKNRIPLHIALSGIIIIQRWCDSRSQSVSRFVGRRNNEKSLAILFINLWKL